MNKKGIVQYLAGLSITNIFIILAVLIGLIIYFSIFMRQIIAIGMVLIGLFIFFKGEKRKNNKENNVIAWSLIGVGLLLLINPFGMFQGFFSVVV